MNTVAPVAWYVVHANIVTLTAWMADQGYTAHTVADAVEQPWSYEEEYNQARAALEADA